jgi:N-methylhydantoinase B
MSRVFDPISLEILWNRLITIVDEAAATLVRASFSTISRESNDLACLLLDSRGYSLAQSSWSVPSFLGCIPRTVRYFLDIFPPNSLEPGDVIMTNDPWLGSGHLPDVIMAKPIFCRGQLLAFSASDAHLPDIGGRVRSPDIREIYEEGLRIPASKIVKKGVANDELLAILLGNVRVPDEVTGDLEAQLAANRTTEKKLLELVEEQGLNSTEDLMALATTIQGHSESAMRKAIAELPDGDYSYEVTCDGFAEPILIRISLSVVGDSIKIDYAGTSPQSERALNAVPNYVYAYTAYAVKCALSPFVPNNEGSFRPIEVSAPEGTILNPRFPVAVGGRAIIGHFLPGAVFGALSQVVPDKVQALSGAPPWILTSSGLDKKGNKFVNHAFFAGGQGATLHMDGLSCTSFPTNVSNVPVEVLESKLPFLTERKEIRQDSGGPGKYRGGCGQEVAMKVVSSSPVTIRFVADRTKFPPEGLLGGKPGALGCLVLNGRVVSPKEERVIQAGDRIVLKTPGGGGMGAPLERDVATVRADVLAGLVSACQAEMEYGAGVLCEKNSKGEEQTSPM